MTTEIQLTDWEAVTSELRRFGATGDVTADDDRIRVDFGSAYIEATKAGTISTGMPLHELDHDGDITLGVDHEDGSITVETDALSYTFRRP
jgi:hypothetical protein